MFDLTLTAALPKSPIGDPRNQDPSAIAIRKLLAFVAVTAATYLNAERMKAMTPPERATGTDANNSTAGSNPSIMEKT